jgi:hypothetical protein
LPGKYNLAVHHINPGGRRREVKIHVKNTIFLVLGLTLCSGRSAAGETGRVRDSALASGEAVIVGALGLPLGTVCRIEGEFVDGSELRMKEYDGVVLMKVGAVDGKSLASPATLRFEQFREGELSGKKSGGAFRTYAYETGRYVGVPPEAFKYVPAVTTTGYFFQTYLVVLQGGPRPGGSGGRTPGGGKTPLHQAGETAPAAGSPGAHVDQ